MIEKRLHGMSTSKARRVQLTGVQLKEKFISDYTKNNIINPELGLSIIKDEKNATFTLKAGTNWQFRLGRFAELDEIGYDIINEGKTIIYKSKDRISELFFNGTMFRKYSFPETLFVCRDGLSWVLFRSDVIIKYIVSNIRVRILTTGRIKVDLLDQTSDKYKAIFTFEYRAENHKRTFVFGAHGGGVGERLKKILMNNCDYELLELFTTSAK
jgi:hypothetical protein